MIITQPIILGSKSPRRKELLKQIIPDFEVLVEETDESYPKNLLPHQIAEFVANAKSSVYSEDQITEKILITADTIVAINEEILGKPKDKQEAINMLTKLSGKHHDVITGVCLRLNSNMETFHETTTVHFKSLSPNDIEYYLDNFKPYDKAGAYGIQEWIGLTAIEKIEGCYYNVVGLPVSALYSKLLAFGTK
ncbi:MAG: septum formation protein Maf [Bacteroidetes bacterium]|nr:MAG: septum formation protein Maf [Bacteroidota bacterium]